MVQIACWIEITIPNQPYNPFTAPLSGSASYLIVATIELEKAKQWGLCDSLARDRRIPLERRLYVI